MIVFKASAMVALGSFFFMCLAEDDTRRSKHELRMSVDDRFEVEDTGDWSVEVQEVLPLRYANVKIVPKKGTSFSMMLYFKCDTPDLAHFDSAEKIKRALVASSRKYVASSVEKAINLKPLNVHGSYGYHVVFTDATLAGTSDPPSGTFRHITRGMIRVSADSALGFSIMSNELDTKEYKTLIDYVTSFVKKKGNKDGGKSSERK
jgi:hypothetical protein